MIRRLACLAFGHHVDAITGTCHMCGQQLLNPINVRRERARLMSDAGRGRITLDEFARRYDATKGEPMHTPASLHPPVATIRDRPHQLLEVEEWRVVDGELCVVGVWANQHGVTRALARAAVVMVPEAVLT